MSKQANPTLIGAFVLGALALAVVAVLLLGGGQWFRSRGEHIMYFEGAAQGLQVGAPVMFLGVKVGTVKQIQIGLDDESRTFNVPVIVEIDQQVVRTRNGEHVDLRDPATVRQLVDRGLRARLRMQSLLTGQLYIDLDFHPDRPARFVGLDPGRSEIPTLRTPVQELATKLEAFPLDKFLTDVAAIGDAVNRLMSDQATGELPRRLDATLRHLESLAARLDAQSGPITQDVRKNLVEMQKALVAAQGALARLENAADRVAILADADSPVARGMVSASEDLAGAARAVRSLTEQESPTTQNLNAMLSEISRAADALRKLAETLEQQPSAIVWGKRRAGDN